MLFQSQKFSLAPAQDSPSRASVSSGGGGSPNLEFYNDPELAECRRNVRELTYQLSSVKREYERRILDLEAAGRETEKQLKEETMKAERYSKDRSFLYDQEKSAVEKAQKLEKEISSLKAETGNSLKQLRKENHELSDELLNTKEAFRRAQSRFEYEAKASSTRGQGLEAFIAQLREESLQQESCISQLRLQLEEAQRNLIEAESRTDRSGSNNEQDRKDMDAIRKQLNDQLGSFASLQSKNRSLAAEAAHYKSIYQNVEVLREEKASLESRLVQTEKLRIRLGELEVENGMLKSEKAKWTTFLTSNGGNSKYSTPEDLVKSLDEQRYEIVALLDRQGELNAELKGKDQYTESLEAKVKELMDVSQKQQESITRDVRHLKRLEKAKSMAQKEVEFLRDQLKSYDMEETTQISGLDLQEQNQKLARITHLESLLDDYKQRVQVLEQEARTTELQLGSNNDARGAENSRVEELSRRLKEFETRSRELTESLSNAVKEKSTAEKEAKSLETQVIELERALGRGEYNRETTRVLEFRENPSEIDFSIRQRDLDSLRAENEELRKRWIDGNASSGEPPKESFLVLERECERMKVVLAEKEKRMVRLKEVISAKLQEVREAVHSLFSYKLEMLDSGRVRLTPSFAPSPVDNFVFESGDHDAGTLTVVGWKSVPEVERLMRLWVTERGSIPAFLGSLVIGIGCGVDSVGLNGGTVEEDPVDEEVGFGEDSNGVRSSARWKDGEGGYPPEVEMT